MCKERVREDLSQSVIIHLFFLILKAMYANLYKHKYFFYIILQFVKEFGQLVAKSVWIVIMFIFDVMVQTYKPDNRLIYVNLPTYRKDGSFYKTIKVE